jgi:hypothetical protein
MTRKQLSRMLRRLALVMAVSAIIVPTAQAMPMQPEGAGVPAEQPAPAALQQSQPESVPQPAPAAQQQTIEGLQIVPATAVQSSSTDEFDWNAFLIGAGISVAVLLLGAGGAMIARRQGHLGYR